MPQDDEKGPLVVIDQTQQDGISASEIQRIARERRERMSREATTSVIEIGRVPKKKSPLPLLVFLAVLGVAIVALIVKSQREPAVDGVIPPVSAAAVSQQPDLSIPPVPTSVTTSTDAVMSAAPIPTNAATLPLPSAGSSNHANANHPAASASPGGDNDPDKALFKTHRTP